MAERCTEPGGSRLHRRDAGHDGDQNIARCSIRVERFEHGRRHGENARIAAGNDGDRVALASQRTGIAGAIRFYAIIARMARLPVALGQRSR